ncbi:hypothetical protein D8674_017527 [Pyrus ussuriensis x Pyrus communis]|uniref:Uncharacterized protein n=1 Tax=Pyrus ussuriensis x Pyrus communis TaxID=2448454 RepID=A0A5N5HG43_9ROSA|nr:hypothetical protein D8674_017527 [Pyrus ussuriensis x Pyrus communis]
MKPARPGKILLKRSQLLLLTRALRKHHPLSLKKMLLPYWKRSSTRARRVGGPHVGDCKLRLKEFLKSLTDRAYTCAQFSRILEAVGETSKLVKHSTKRSWKTDKKETHRALAVDDRSDYNLWKKKERKRDRETYPPLARNDKEFQAILGAMFVGGAIKLPKPYKVPFREYMKDPRYYRYHQCMGHPSTACQTLRRILYAKIYE